MTLELTRENVPEVEDKPLAVTELNEPDAPAKELPLTELAVTPLAVIPLAFMVVALALTTTKVVEFNAFALIVVADTFPLIIASPLT
jgi:hypothetical protein